MNYRKQTIGFAGIILCAAVSLVGCSSLKTTVLPGKDHHTIIATARDQSTARDGAVEKAKEYCSQVNKHLTVLDEKTEYQGINKTAGVLSDKLSSASFLNGGPNVGSTKENDDYKTTLQFTCE